VRRSGRFDRIRDARVAIADVNPKALVTAASEVAGPGNVMTIELDVADRVAVSATADALESELGKVRAVFNNAGVADSVSPAAMRGEDWDGMVDINLCLPG
jgi:NAD(P)-dependent dehydrogenase (short-subunit alcohol dehydrogenase family)